MLVKFIDHNNPNFFFWKIWKLKGTIQKFVSLIRIIRFLLCFSECIYENLQFSGGDLKIIEDTTFSSCKNACEFLEDCTFFSLQSGKCFLKSEHVEIERETGVLSGMTDEACGKSLMNLKKATISQTMLKVDCVFHFKINQCL